MGTARSAAAKGAPSAGVVAGQRMKGSPVSGSGIASAAAVGVHAPPTAERVSVVQKVSERREKGRGRCGRRRRSWGREGGGA